MSHASTPDTLTRLDAFANLLTGAGDPDVDKGIAWVTRESPQLGQGALRRIWRNSYYARRIVNLPSADSLVRGWKLLDPNDKFAPEDFRWKTEAQRLELKARLYEADTTASALGTGYMIPITFDGDNTLESLEKPLDLSRLYTVSQILVLTPEECVPERVWSTQSAMSDILRPSGYRLHANHGLRLAGRWGKALAGEILVHPSRVIPIIGERLSVSERMHRTFGEGGSIIQNIFEALARAEGVDAAAATLAQEMKQDVVRIPDMAAIGTSDAKDAFMLRMRLMKVGMSMFRMVVLGAGEEFESRANAVTGFKDLSESGRNALVAASGIPEPILFGKAASGLATAPGTEQDAYIRLVEDRQEQRIEPALRRILHLVGAAKGDAFGGSRRHWRYEIRFNPLTRESLKDMEARRLIQTQRDSVYAGMLSNVGDTAGAAQFARFIIENRHGADGWQDELPPFRFEADLSPTPAPPAPSPGGESSDRRQGNQLASENANKPKSFGAPGVDLQASNSGERKFDAVEFLYRLDQI